MKARIHATDARSLHDNCDSAWLDGFLDGHRNLSSEAFLDLQASTEGFGDTCELREPQYQVFGYICDRHLSMSNGAALRERGGGE